MKIIPISELSGKTLKKILLNPKTSETHKKEINKELNSRSSDANIDWLMKFLNPNENKFLNLARWQLYREGKAKKYYNGSQLYFVIEDKIELLNKMQEIRAAFGKFETNNSKELENIEEFNTWKR